MEKLPLWAVKQHVCVCYLSAATLTPQKTRRIHYEKLGKSEVLKMKKITSTMTLISFFVATIFTGCTTTRYSVAIAGVPNISRVYIRNAGATSWGSNIAGNLQNIDRSRFSDRVDVRVIDANGTVFTRHNIPFNRAAFEVTSRSSSMNRVFGTVLLIGGIAILALIIPSE